MLTNLDKGFYVGEKQSQCNNMGCQKLRFLTSKTSQTLSP